MEVVVVCMGQVDLHFARVVLLIFVTIFFGL